MLHAAIETGRVVRAGSPAAAAPGSIKKRRARDEDRIEGVVQFFINL
jgi:hypothetical protein